MKFFKSLLCTICVCSLFCCTPIQNNKNDEENAVIETIMTRRSVRKYQPQAINRDTMQVIMECGINAPKAFI